MNSPTLVTRRSGVENITPGFFVLSLPLTKAAGGSSTGEADGHEAGAKRKRATSDGRDHDAGVKKKPATFETGGRQADADDYRFDAYEKLQPTRKRNKKGGVRVRSGNCVYCL